MKQFVGKLIVCRDATGYSTEGTLERLDGEGGIAHLVLVDSRQVNYHDTESGTIEFWDIPGENWIALHLCAGVAESHLPKREAPKKAASGRR